MDMGISIFAGEAEKAVLDIVLRTPGTAAEAALQLHERPAGHRGCATPRLPPAALARNEGRKSSLTWPRLPVPVLVRPSSNVQRPQEPLPHSDDLEAIVRENYKQGITRSSSRRQHGPQQALVRFLDRLIELKENEGIEVSLITRSTQQCHRIPNFIQKARWAGVYRVFIGLENVNPDNLLAAKKRQNKITEYRKMLQAWHASGASTWAGYILGFPGDTRESIMRDLEIIKNELPLDILEFFMLTPLPGSEDHQPVEAGLWMDPDSTSPP